MNKSEFDSTSLESIQVALPNRTDTMRVTNRSRCPLKGLNGKFSEKLTLPPQR